MAEYIKRKGIDSQLALGRTPSPMLPTTTIYVRIPVAPLTNMV